MEIELDGEVIPDRSDRYSNEYTDDFTEDQGNATFYTFLLLFALFGVGLTLVVVGAVDHSKCSNQITDDKVRQSGTCQKRSNIFIIFGSVIAFIPVMIGTYFLWRRFK